MQRLRRKEDPEYILRYGKDGRCTVCRRRCAHDAALYGGGKGHPPDLGKEGGCGIRLERGGETLGLEARSPPVRRLYPPLSADGRVGRHRLIYESRNLF